MSYFSQILTQGDFFKTFLVCFWLFCFDGMRITFELFGFFVCICFSIHMRVFFVLLFNFFVFVFNLPAVSFGKII